MKAFVWGATHSGAIGFRPSQKRHTEQQIQYPKVLPLSSKVNIVDAAAGYGFSIFVAKDACSSVLYGTGINTDGQLGLQPKSVGDILYNPCPINLPRELGDTAEDVAVKCVSAGRAHFAVVCANGKVFTFGDNSFGQCARSSKMSGNIFVAQRIDRVGGERVEFVECGQDHTLFVSETGKVFSCGWGADGQTGLGNGSCIYEPAKIDGDIKGERIVKVSSRADCVLALNDKGDVFGWGNTEYGQLVETLNEVTQVNIPRKLKKCDALGKIVDIAAGGTTCLALNESGDVFSWGYGALGSAQCTEDSCMPKLVPRNFFGNTEFSTNTKVLSVFAGMFHMGAINSEGDLYMWGDVSALFHCQSFGSKETQKVVSFFTLYSLPTLTSVPGFIFFGNVYSVSTRSVVEICLGSEFVGTASSVIRQRNETLTAKAVCMVEMGTEKVRKLIHLLEMQELEDDSGVDFSQLYLELLVAHVYVNDLYSARYLWKRIPQKIKNENAEFSQMHDAYNALWNNNTADFFKFMDYNWSSHVAELTFELKEKVKQELLDLIGKAYTSIFENVLIEMANITSNKVNDVCAQLDWEIESGSYPRLIKPKHHPNEQKTVTRCEDQLHTLTDFVSFLEN